jgi:FAD/FMN-containing dehydrogenase
MVTTQRRTNVDAAALTELGTRFRGEVCLPDAPSYEDARKIWNGSIDRYPAVIAKCAGVADVIAAVKFARQTGLQAAVRSGGHSFPGQSVCDDGLMIDLSPMRGVRVDPGGRTARAQAGVLLGELDRETQQFGLAVPAGIVTTTGMAGLTLGGGIGWLMRKFGLTIDQLLSVDMVTADGSFVKASEKENPELFWGVRGAGSNFGIVTDFEFRLQPVGPTVLAGPIIWPMEKSAEVLRFYRDWITDVPDELTTIVVHRMAPPLPAIPAEMHGKPVVIVVACYSGDPEEGEKVVQPMKEFSSPILDLCVPKPFVAHQSMFDPSFPQGWWYYFRSADLAELNDDVIDIVARNAMKITSPLTAFPIFQLGGAISRVDEDATSYSGRNAGHTININATTETEEGFDEGRAWSRNFWEELKPWHQSVYVNFLMDEGEERIREAYGAKKYDRLAKLKAQYDPENMFRMNQNIKPAK